MPTARRPNVDCFSIARWMTAKKVSNLYLPKTIKINKSLNVQEDTRIIFDLISIMLYRTIYTISARKFHFNITLCLFHYSRRLQRALMDNI